MQSPSAQSSRAGRSPRRAPTSRTRPVPRATIAARRARVAAWTAAIAAVVLLFLAVGERAYYSGKVMPGVDVEGAHVAGRTELASLAAITTLANRLEHAPLRARIGNQVYSVDRSLLLYHVDPVATVRAARRAGRSRNPIEQVAGTVLRRFRDDQVAPVIDYDDDRLQGVLDAWSDQTTHGLVEGALRFDGTNVTTVEPHAGTGIRRDEAVARLRSALRDPSAGVVTLPVGTVQPDVDAAAVAAAASQARAVLTGDHVLVTQAGQVTITPVQLASALGTRASDHRLALTIDGPKLRAALGSALAPLEVAPVDASFTVDAQNAVQVVPSRRGREIDMAAVASAILAGHRRIDAPLRDVEPAHDTAWAQKLGITRQVSTFTTYHPAGQPRVHNIHLAADVLNNTVVEPGQVFSLNDRLGRRTPDKGYVKAPVIGDNEFVEDYGGGISQLTTTLYNAVFFGGYQDVEHTPHSIYISRYPMGREATINYGVTDLKFRDDTSHGVLIRTSYTDTSITVTFYGDNDGRTVHEVDRKVDAVEPIKDEQIACPAPPDVDTNNDCAKLTLFQTKKIADGETGYTVEFTQVIDQPGRAEVRHHYRWRYQMFTNKILVGTAAPTTTTTAPKTTTTRPNTTTTQPGGAPPTTKPHP